MAIIDLAMNIISLCVKLVGLIALIGLMAILFSLIFAIFQRENKDEYMWALVSKDEQGAVKVIAIAKTKESLYPAAAHHKAKCKSAMLYYELARIVPFESYHLLMRETK